MKVMKFGGSSVGSDQAIRNVQRIVEQTNDDSIVVVVAAFDGITDALLRTATLAGQGESSYEKEFDAIAARHLSVAQAVVLPDRREETKNAMESILNELSNILKGIFLIRDLSPKTTNTILCYGERLSSTILCGAIAGAELFDARQMIRTNPYFGKHVVDYESTEKSIRTVLAKRPRIAIVAGYIASDTHTGEITNLGRGGSDHTAALIAASLDASVLEIWTDVDGFMTADPKIIDNPYQIERLTFVEAMELCNFGARVIYPSSIFPVYHKNIPIQVKNTFRPDSPGTFISSESDPNDHGKPIKGISSINDTCLVTIRGLGMVGVIGINRRIFTALSDAGISVFFVSQASSENTTSIGVRNGDADEAVEVLSKEFHAEIALGEINEISARHNLATLAIVGEQMRNTPGVAGRLFDTLGRGGINVIACAQGASETNISCVISLDQLRKAINLIHDAFFLWEYQVLNLFLAGIGTVGGSLLEQIRQQQPTLMENNSLQIRIVGVANSRRMLIDRNGIDPANCKEELEKRGTASSPERLRDEIVRMNIFNPIFVDCTANADIASIYGTLLEHNISVVAANKIAASGPYTIYESLKQTARRRGVKFLFETNVGAGLPIIHTINDLLNSGDRILRIDAVVSGTLNYIFNEMNEELPMSAAIRKAMEAGYAEPDPRIDLSGTDVVRKLVILSREAGYPIEQDDVEKELFIPKRYFEGSIETFWQQIPEIDAEFERQRREISSKGLRWRFIASMENGKASVSLRAVDSVSPFYYLDGSNNVILITTERYKEYPMQIKGYGAGAAVTAAGVFADIISIANIR